MGVGVELKNKPVNPVIERYYPETKKIVSTEGMSLREYYAGLAMQALLAKGQTGESVAIFARTYADELIEALSD